jgi:hypothetical protein
LKIYAKLGYTEDVNLACLGGNDKIPRPKDDEIVVFKSFFVLVFIT